MNVKNLLKVKALILEEPRRFSMNHWETTNMSFLPEGKKPACGTIACIAGWGAILLVKKDGRLKSFKAAAVKTWAPEWTANTFFELDAFQGGRLYFEENWPNDLHERLKKNENGSAEYAQIAAEAIDRFIACGGDWGNDPGPALVQFPLSTPASAEGV